MKYMLKAKRWNLMSYLYGNCRKYGTTDQVLFFDSEKDVLNFFRVALEEDIADKTASMDKNHYYNGAESLQLVMEIASSNFKFRDVVKNRFNMFIDMAAKALGKDNTYRSYWISYTLKCNPRNYKLFTIVDQDIRGCKFQKIEAHTWYKFYKKCVADGMKKDFSLIPNE